MIIIVLYNDRILLVIASMWYYATALKLCITHCVIIECRKSFFLPNYNSLFKKKLLKQLLLIAQL